MRILFSPLGDTDPVRGCYDGAMLHIVRHYQPERIVLFYTHDMAEKERHDHRYTRAVQRLAPECQIEEVFTEIRDAHLYESFSRILPQEVLRIRETYPGSTLLLNLSSGTPQMKTVLAMLASDMEHCIGVQVAAPARHSNRANEATQDAEDIDALLENNFDNEEGAENRCEEPPLSAFHYYAERSRILSLIDSYEYAAAGKIARRSALVPSEASLLLSHAERRSMLLTEEAKAVLREYEGKKLFPFTGKTEELVEYFLMMQIDQETGRLSNLMLRMIPFLYEFLREYTAKNLTIPIRSLCEPRHGVRLLVRERLTVQEKELLAALDREFPYGYRDQPLSFYLLSLCCTYAGEAQRIRDAKLHTAVMVELESIADIRQLRNEAAHEIVNVTEDQFRQKVGMGSQEAVSCFCRMLALVYGDKVRAMRSTYRDLNAWIGQALEVHA
ncbi:type III-A CRISPR-associated CARF protein Csm6 [Selenomonas felix]|uniref:type III-A CRISPR-associated CARF protein Csm6 n=1 Tax=Selenomonas felix TaxID=1944634 RepID=UPI000C815D9F|nr:hypothetical protein [Selenomonas felix]